MAALHPEYSLLDWALWNADQGLRVFPVKGDAKFPPLVSAPYDAATTDPIRIIEWWSQWPDANIGIDTSHLLVVDIDVKEHKNGYEAAKTLGLLDLDTLKVGTPSDGEHIYTRPSAPVPGGVDTLGPGVDTRGHHNYVLGVGSSVGGRKYFLKSGSAIAASPEAALTRKALIERNAVPLVELDTDTAVRLGLDFARTAPAAIEGMGGDAHTYKIAAVVREYGISESVCFDLLLEHWNERCEPPWHPEELRRKVANAYQYAQAQPGAAHPDHIFAGVSIEAPRATRPATAWFTKGDDWRGSVRWLYKGLLPTTGVVVLTAPSQAGKTFLALHLADTLRSGEPFFETRAREKGGTIILSGEGFGSVKHRMAALGQPGERLPISARYVGALAANGAWGALCEDVRARAAVMKAEFGMPVRMIVLDTLSASGALEDENDNAKAATVVKAFAELSVALDCLFIVLHHPPKSGHGERGAGAIRNNADYVVEIKREGFESVRHVEITKSRDSDQKTLGSFTLLPVVIGQDEDGDDETTMVVSTGVPVAVRDREPPNADKFLEVLDNTILVPEDANVFDGAVQFEDLLSRFIEAKSGSNGRTNAKLQFKAIIAHYVKRLVVETINAGGTEYIRRKEIRI